MRVRSRWFILSGALGGLLGFLLMDRVYAGAETFTGNVLRMSFYFAGFGLVVGLALGVTEGVVKRRPGQAIYGLLMGMILGGVGGFAGGAIGQAVYGLVPRTHIVHSTSDLAIVLDSSGSMGGFFFWGNDPWGERRSAAKNVIDRLAPTDRVAVIDFDDEATVLQPLSFMGSQAARKAAKAAVDKVDNEGGSNLSAGLDAAVRELAAHKVADRPRFIIFLTDGEGDYSPESASLAQREGIKIYTVGLGDAIPADLLGSIATETGGRYYSVANASELTTLFEKILREHSGIMAEAETAESDTNPLILLALRILSWAVMGLLIGLGQGVRENTREDLRACALGGFLGGALGGALFDPVVTLVTAGSGIAGRALADLVVGACIGGSMRLAQEKIVEASGKELTLLLSVLPKRASLTFRPSPPPLSRLEAAPKLAPYRPVSRPSALERHSLHKVSLTEDELDTLVSIAISRAEILDETQSPGAADAWSEVMIYEERLAALTRPEEIPGGIARVGAVTAALEAGLRSEAVRLASRYLAEEALPSERREAIRRAFQTDKERSGNS